jgi:epoxyqueuosine reductase
MSLSAELKAFARSIGFHLVGITSAAPFHEAELDITRWLAEGHQGDMAWLNEARARLASRPEELLPGARSLVVVGVSYRTEEPAPRPDGTGRIARYAWGNDYHDVMKTRLRALGSFLSERLSRQVRSRVFVDDGPLVERDAAARAGLGFRGKNTNLLTPIGSFVFLGALLTDAELEVDRPIARDCGSCRLCIDACPTGALDEPGVLDSTRCLSYWTQTPQTIPEPYREELGASVYGCDICQDVCPWNRGVEKRRADRQLAADAMPTVSLVDWLERDGRELVDELDRLYVPRNDPRWLRRNALVALGNTGTSEHLPVVARWAAGEDEVLRETATWAERRIAERTA